LDEALKVLVGRGNDPDVDLDHSASANPCKGLLLQHPNDLALCLQRHVRHLVKQQRSAVRPLESADLGRRVGSLGPGFSPKEFALETVRMHRGAVECDEGLPAAPRALVQQPGHDLLAGPRRTGDQHPAAGRRDLLDGLAQMHYDRRRAKQISGGPGPDPELFHLHLELGGLERSLHYEQQTIRLEGLFDKVISAMADRLDGHFDCAVTADHHNGQSGLLAHDHLQKLQAVE
jgi:hypothetical protein